MKVAWTKLAIADVGHAFDFVAEDSPAAAAKIIDSIERTVSILSRHSEIGRPGRVKGTREMIVAGTPFIIPYRVSRGRLEILAVIHGARRWPDPN